MIWEESIAIGMGSKAKKLDRLLSFIVEDFESVERRNSILIESRTDETKWLLVRL